MPSPNTDPNKRNSGNGDHHHNGLRTFGIPCPEDARSVPQTRSDRYASSIVHLRRKPVVDGRFSLFRFKSFPTEIPASLFLGKDLRIVTKYFTGDQCYPLIIPPIPNRSNSKRLGVSQFLDG